MIRSRSDAGARPAASPTSRTHARSNAGSHAGLLPAMLVPILLALFLPGLAAADTYLEATGNPCFAPSGGGACGGLDLAWRGDALSGYTHVQMWRDDDDHFWQMTCPDCCLPTEVAGDKTGFSVGAAPKGFSLFYATGCDEEDVDFRQLAGRVFLHQVPDEGSAIYADDNPCLALDNACESTLVWASDLQDPSYDYVELWREDANGVNAMKCAALGSPGETKTIGVGANPKTYKLYPVATCNLAATTPPASTPVAEVTVSRRQKTAGVSFIPYILDGQSNRVKDFLLDYDDSAIRAQVVDELQDIRCASGLTHIKLEVPAHSIVSWPEPSSSELQHLADFFEDAYDSELKVLFNLGTQCSVPNSALDPYRKQKIIGGSWRGDRANGATAFWDVTECTDDTIDIAIEWYEDVLDGVISRLATAGIDAEDVIDVVVVQGNYLSALTPEMRLNDDLPALGAPNPYLAETQDYLEAVMPSLQDSYPDLRFGVQARYYPGLPDADRFKFLANLADAVPFSELDYVAYSSYPELVDPMEETTNEMLAVVGRANARKMVLSDFKNSTFDNDTEFDLQVDNLEYHLTEAREYRLGGWWYWTYRDDPNDPDRWRGLRDATTTSPYDDGWYEDFLDLIDTDVASSPPAYCP